MVQPSRRSNFWVSLFALILYTLICAAIPIYHQVTGRDLKPALNINLDSIYLLIFLSGAATIVVGVGLHRRITALEEEKALHGQQARVLGSPHVDENV